MWLRERWGACRQAIAGLSIYRAISNPVSAQCVPYPIAATIGNVSLSNGQLARGVALSVGEPPQDFAFLPQWPLSNIIVYETNGYCTDPAPESEDGCTTWRGGQYNMLESETRRQDAEDDHPRDGSQYPEMRFYTDVFKINENITLDDFSLGVPLQDWAQQGYHPMMAFGLGEDSTILRALKSGNHIASRTWSMFFGWTGANSNTQLDGTFVFGGYDRAKVYGQGYTQDLKRDERCATDMLVVIDDVVLNFPNGTDASIVAKTSSGPFEACIIPDYPVMMTIAYDPYMLAFIEHTNTSISQRSFGVSYYSLLYNDGDEPYRGDMTINIRDGPAIRIRNSQLVVPERYIEEDGQLVADYSRSNLVINSLQDINANDMGVLGRQFLSAAYVMVNQDTRKFTVWEANPTSVENLVGVNEEGEDNTDWCVPEPVASASEPVASASERADPSPDQAPTEDGGNLPSGAIAGIAIGGVTFLAIIICVAFWQLRRRKASAAADPRPQSDAPTNQGETTYHTPYQNQYFEVDPNSLSKQEPKELQGAEVRQLPNSQWQETPPRNEPRYELTG
ncbi:hypothetical protein DL768_004244 [Monosporascus sp. mg162]|nr:hypothetical protein DL768_004244 [Monosporascus sp. mg162]